MKRKVMVIGPTQAGKTFLIAALNVAIYSNKQDSGLVPTYAMHVQNTALEKAIDNVQSMVSGAANPIAGSTAMTQYTFELEYLGQSHNKSSTWNSSGEGDGGIFSKWAQWLAGDGTQKRTRGSIKPGARVQFNIIDGPGGALFPFAEDFSGSMMGEHVDEVVLGQERDIMIEQAKECNSLLIVCDWTNHNTAHAFFNNLDKFLNNVGNPVPFEDVLLLLNKCDLVVQNRFQELKDLGEQVHDREANKWIDNLNIHEAVMSYLTDAVIRRITSKLPTPRKLYACACSNYGFLPTGEANVDEDGKRLRVHSGLADVTFPRAIKSWRPHNVMEAFTYFLHGRPDAFVDILNPR